MRASGQGTKEKWYDQRDGSYFTYASRVYHLYERCGRADQIQASYSSQSRSHKWWHRIFWAMLDITEVNMYIIYLHACRGRPEEAPTPMTHLEFKNALCEALLLGWRRRKEVNNEALTH
jgi:hypothetical protein